MLTPPNTGTDPGQAFDRLVKIVDDLRENCPWDKKQTLESLRYLTIEETYELADAILEHDLKGVTEELGDLIMHMIFYARLSREENGPNITDALNGISEKLISRHPHVYGDLEVADEVEVKKNWENLKLKEGKKSILDGVPSSLPALVKAIRIQEKVGQVGFDWDDAGQVWKKVEEETAEFQEAKERGDLKAMEDEMGDILFSMVNYARFEDIDPESALERTNKKFMARFRQMEEGVLNSGKSLKDMSLGEMEDAWQAAKNK